MGNLPSAAGLEKRGNAVGKWNSRFELWVNRNREGSDDGGFGSDQRRGKRNDYVLKLDEPFSEILHLRIELNWSVTNYDAVICPSWKLRLEATTFVAFALLQWQCVYPFIWCQPGESVKRKKKKTDESDSLTLVQYPSGSRIKKFKKDIWLTKKLKLKENRWRQKYIKNNN